MRMTRLPGIHHDANCVVVQGEASVLLIDAGTSWYQALQVERILGLLSDDVRPEHLLLTSRRYPFAGAAAHFVEQWPDLRVHVGEAGVSALETGDFFSTWANRYDSDMPSVQAEPVADGDLIALGDGGVQAFALRVTPLRGLGTWLKTVQLRLSGQLFLAPIFPQGWICRAVPCLNTLRA